MRDEVLGILLDVKAIFKEEEFLRFGILGLFSFKFTCFKSELMSALWLAEVFYPETTSGNF